MEAKLQKPVIDKQAPAPKQSVDVVMSMAALQSQAGRINRLRTLGRTNPDVAWLIRLAGDKFGEITRSAPKPAAPKAKAQKSRPLQGEAAHQGPAEAPDAGDASGDFHTGGGKG